VGKAKEPHVPGRLVKGPGTVRWHAEKVVKTVAAVVREQKDKRKA
jgi:hypothetical protein